MPFSSLRLSNALVKELANQEFTKPTPIQEQAIPAILDGKDVLGIAPTGSGKTASFVLPTLMNVAAGPELPNRHPAVLVLVPTRELAMQVQEVFRVFGDALPTRIKSMSVFGGASINPQMKAMMGVQVLVATPGRLIELAESNAVHLGRIQTLILDEADKLLNMGFKEEVNSILKLLPPARQNLLFSATLSEEVEKIKELLLNDPVVARVVALRKTIDLIQQTAYHVLPEKKGPLLRHLIKSQNLKQVLIFTSSTHTADQLAKKLRQNDIQVQVSHGKKSQKARTDALRHFKSGDLRVLIATDLLARGIDIEFLPCVINYELPRSPKDYIHRIGRTGRAEAPGEAISFVTPDDLHHFKVIQKKAGKWVKLTYTEDMEF